MIMQSRRPKRGPKCVISRYSATVSTQPSGQRQPEAASRARSIARDRQKHRQAMGSTYQNVASAWSAMFSASGRVAPQQDHAQHREPAAARRLARPWSGRRLPISAMATISAPDSSALASSAH